MRSKIFGIIAVILLALSDVGIVASASAKSGSAGGTAAPTTESMTAPQDNSSEEYFDSSSLDEIT